MATIFVLILTFIFFLVTCDKLLIDNNTFTKNVIGIIHLLLCIWGASILINKFNTIYFIKTIFVLCLVNFFFIFFSIKNKDTNFKLIYFLIILIFSGFLILNK